MFRGVNTISLDAKGRMAMPARYRDMLMEQYSGHLVATIDMGGKCLLLYPIDEWEVVQAKLEALPNFKPKSRLAQRVLIGHAADLEMDGSGRILLPQILRDRARLDKQIALVGQGKKFEIWNGDSWDSLTDSLFADAESQEELTEEMMEISI